jgi:hypothetical protein
MDDIKQIELTKMVMRLFVHWRLPEEDQIILLGFNASDIEMLVSFREGNTTLATEDLEIRVSHLLNIHCCLRTLFPRNREIVYRWTSQANQGELFHGRRDLPLSRSYQLLYKCLIAVQSNNGDLTESAT